jgi:hypothetical protein
MRSDSDNVGRVDSDGGIGWLISVNADAQANVQRRRHNDDYAYAAEKAGATARPTAP